MQPFRFSIRMMLLITACLSVCLAALMYPLPQVARSLTHLLWLLLFASVLASVFRRGAVQAFWLGFAVFGFGKLRIIKETLSIDVLSYVHQARFGDPISRGPLGGRYATFLSIGESFELLFVALLGGAIAVYLYRTRNFEGSSPLVGPASNRNGDEN